MSVSIVSSNLLDAPELYIGHQCNCVTIGNGAGLAKLLFKKFPYANTYIRRTEPSCAGSYSVHGNGKERRFVVNLYAQYHPGKARKLPDTKDKRLEWLISGLNQFVAACSPPDFALPYGIGCGLAGGEWEDYFHALEDFSSTTGLQIRLYKI